MKTPELLAPAGNLKNLRYAIAYGADAVYAGMPRYSLRVRNNDFDSAEQLQHGIDEVHAAGKQFFQRACRFRRLAAGKKTDQVNLVLPRQKPEIIVDKDITARGGRIWHYRCNNHYGRHKLIPCRRF